MDPILLTIHRVLWRLAILAFLAAALSIWMRARGIEQDRQVVLLFLMLSVVILLMWALRAPKPLTSPQKSAGTGKTATAKAGAPKLALHDARPILATARRSSDGRFRVDVRLNGHPVSMIVDSGASGMALPYELMGPLGVDINRLDFCLAVDTANGTSRAAPLILPSIQLGKASMTKVEAAVAERGCLSEPLLGMSVISQFAEVVINGGQMTFRGKPAAKGR